MAYGRDIAHGEIKSANIIDITPTIYIVLHRVKDSKGNAWNDTKRNLFISDFKKRGSI